MNAVVLYILTYKMYLNYKTVFCVPSNITWNEHISKRLHIHIITPRTRQNFIVLQNEGNEIVLGFISKLMLHICRKQLEKFMFKGGESSNYNYIYLH